MEKTTHMHTILHGTTNTCMQVYQAIIIVSMKLCSLYKCSVSMLLAIASIVGWVKRNSTYPHGNSGQNDTQQESVDDVGYDQPQGVVGVPLGIVVVIVDCAMVVALYIYGEGTTNICLQSFGSAIKCTFLYIHSVYLCRSTQVQLLHFDLWDQRKQHCSERWPVPPEEVGHAS